MVVGKGDSNGGRLLSEGEQPFSNAGTETDVPSVRTHTLTSIADDFDDCRGQSVTTKCDVNGKRKGLPIGHADNEHYGAKGVDVEREEEEEERVVR